MKLLTETDLNETSWLPEGNGLFVNFYVNGNRNSQPIGFVSVADQRSLHCGFFGVVAFVHDENNGNFGKLIKYETITGEILSHYFSAKIIRTSAIFDDLIDKGYFIADDSEVQKRFRAILNRFKIDKFAPYFAKTGYSDKFHGYALPEGFHTKEGKKLAVYKNNDTKLLKRLSPSGEYEDWKVKIANQVVLYPISTFALLVALSAPLFPFLDIGTIFVHFFGLSSRGKTTLLQLAASIFGNGSDPRSSNISSISQWNATPAGLEGMAALYNGTVGLFDELHLCKDKDFPDAVYALCGGKPKNASKPNGKLQERESWEFPALSCGEQSGLEKIEKSNDPTIGERIRFLDIQIEDQIFTNFDGIALGDELAEQLASSLKATCGTHYGHAGRDFMQQLLRLGDTHTELKSLIDDEMADIFKQLRSTEKLKPEEMRVMHHFSAFILAGNLAVEFGILNMTKEDVFKSVCHVKDIWLKNMRIHNARIESQNVAQLSQKKDYVDMLKQELLRNFHLYPHVKDTTKKSKVRGYCQSKAKGDKYNNYLLTENTFNEVFQGCDLLEVKEKLVELAVLSRAKDQFKKSYNIYSLHGKDENYTTIRLYTVDSAIVDDAPEEDIALSDEEWNLILERRKEKLE